MLFGHFGCLGSEDDFYSVVETLTSGEHANGPPEEPEEGFGNGNGNDWQRRAPSKDE